MGLVPWGSLLFCVGGEKDVSSTITEKALLTDAYHASLWDNGLKWHLWKPQSTSKIWRIWKLRPTYSPETPNLGQNRWCFVPWDLGIWWMTLENNRASLLCCFKLCATFHSHWWIQTGVTVWKRPIWVKFDDFQSCVTLKFDVWPWKTIGHLYYATSSSMHPFLAIGELKLELQSGNAHFGSKFDDF